MRIRSAVGVATFVVASAVVLFSGVAGAESSSWATSAGASPDPGLMEAAQSVASQYATSGSGTLGAVAFGQTDFREQSAYSIGDALAGLGSPRGTGWSYGYAVSHSPGGVFNVVVVFGSNRLPVTTTTTPVVVTSTTISPQHIASAPVAPVQVKTVYVTKIVKVPVAVPSTKPRAVTGVATRHVTPTKTPVVLSSPSRQAPGTQVPWNFVLGGGVVVVLCRRRVATLLSSSEEAEK